MGDGRMTMARLAAELGVSRSTVSNAFNRPDQLSDELRDRILHAAAAHHYAGPDPAARSLRRGRTGAVGFLFDSPMPYVFEDPAAIEMLRGVAAACQEANVSLVLVPRLMTDGSVDVVSTALVDGFVTLCESLGEERRRAVTARGLPIVALDAPVLEDEPFVGVDDRLAAAEIARHVLGLGHRRLAVVTLHADDGRPASLADDPATTAPRRHVSVERHRGYRDAIAAAGLDPASVPVLHGGPTSIDAGRRAVAATLRRPERPTAILAMSDQLALGAIAEATSLGLRVPDDLSVAGYDGIAAADDAGLTTVRQPQFDKGAAAIRLLLGGAAPGHRTVLPTELVVGGTTAPPPR